MSATRSRLRFSGEWLAAAAFLVATLVVRELRVAPQAFSDGGEQTSTTSAGVPPEAVSVPKLMLGEANEIRVGDRGDAAVARLDAGVVLIKTTVERGPLSLHHLRHGPVVLADVGAAQRAGQRHPSFHGSRGDRNHHIDRLPVRVLK